MTVVEFIANLNQLGIEVKAQGDKLQISAPKDSLTAELREELRRRKPELLEYLTAQQTASQSGPPPLRVVPRDQLLPLSYAQQRLWFLDQLVPENNFYNVRVALRLEGTLDVPVFQRVMNELAARHEVLRTTFKLVDGSPVQAIAPPAPVTTPLDDLSHLPDETRATEARARLNHETGLPFNLSTGPLWRARLLRLGSEEHILALTMHHSISDAWTMGIFIRELTVLYQAFLAGRPSPLPPQELQYADYSVWQREWLQGEELERQLAFWERKLAGLETLQLPTDRARPQIQTFRGAFESMSLSREMTREFKLLCQKQGITPFIGLLAAFNTLLAYYSGQTDIVIGSPIANRNRAEIENILGFFLNMQVIRTDLSGDPTLLEILARVRGEALQAYEHQDLPFEMLVDRLESERDLSRNPLFQVTFTLQTPGRGQLSLAGMKTQSIRLDNETTHFDLEAHVWDGAEELAFHFVYSTDLFETVTIRRMIGHFKSLIGALVANPAQRLSELELMDESERREVVQTWNGTGREYPRQSGLAELFEAQAARTPDAAAIEFGAARLSYGELNGLANRLAHRLRALGVGVETPVALYLERSAWQIAAMLGIIKAGGAYVPLDPSYPAERLGFMLADSGAPVLISEPGLAGALPAHTAQVLELEPGWETLAHQSVENPAPSGATGESLAYVIYTSGSTGTPKGVAVVQRGVSRLVLNTDYIALGPGERVAQASNSSFDAATFEIWGPLLNGGVVVGFEREAMLSPVDFGRALAERGVSTLFVTTALFNQFAREAPGALSPLTTVLFGGEAVDPACVRKVLSTGAPQRLLHVYGPTESTTFATWQHVQAVADEARTVPIGRPIANTRAYVLDPQRRPVPVGVAGELYMGGDGLAREYLKRPELTAERFVPDPFSADPTQRLYRTGDVVRWNARGEIEFLGRVDHQVKLRGFRIELGEIEARLMEQDGVRAAVVLVREDEPGDRRLVAYVTPAEGKELTLGSLRQALKQKLPEYMLPAAFVVLEELPLTPNGKINRKALPAPEGRRQVEQVYEAPRTELEERIAAIWRDVLRVDRVGLNDNFFELGGNSILMVRARSQLVTAFDRAIPMVEMFKNPTVNTLAAYLSREDTERPAFEDEAAVAESMNAGKNRMRKQFQKRKQQASA